MKNVASKNNLALQISKMLKNVQKNLDFLFFIYSKKWKFGQEKFEEKLQEKEEKMSLKTENLLKNGNNHAR